MSTSINTHNNPTNTPTRDPHRANDQTSEEAKSARGLSSIRKWEQLFLSRTTKEEKEVMDTKYDQDKNWMDDQYFPVTTKDGAPLNEGASYGDPPRGQSKTVSGTPVTNVVPKQRPMTIEGVDAESMTVANIRADIPNGTPFEALRRQVRSEARGVGSTAANLAFFTGLDDTKNSSAPLAAIGLRITAAEMCLNAGFIPSDAPSDYFDVAVVTEDKAVKYLQDNPERTPFCADPLLEPEAVCCLLSLMVRGGISSYAWHDNTRPTIMPAISRFSMPGGSNEWVIIARTNHEARQFMHPVGGRAITTRNVNTLFGWYARNFGKDFAAGARATAFTLGSVYVKPKRDKKNDAGDIHAYTIQEEFDKDTKAKWGQLRKKPKDDMLYYPSWESSKFADMPFLAPIFKAEGWNLKTSVPIDDTNFGYEENAAAGQNKVWKTVAWTQLDAKVLGSSLSQDDMKLYYMKRMAMSQSSFNDRAKPGKLSGDDPDERVINVYGLTDTSTNLAIPTLSIERALPALVRLVVPSGVSDKFMMANYNPDEVGHAWRRYAAMKHYMFCQNAYNRQIDKSAIEMGYDGGALVLSDYKKCLSDWVFIAGLTDESFYQPNIMCLEHGYYTRDDSMKYALFKAQGDFSKDGYVIRANASEQLESTYRYSLTVRDDIRVNTNTMGQSLCFVLGKNGVVTPFSLPSFIRVREKRVALEISSDRAGSVLDTGCAYERIKGRYR